MPLLAQDMRSGSQEDGGLSEEALQQILKQFEGDEGMEAMLSGMVESLMSREILEEPMRDLQSRVCSAGCGIRC